MNRHSHTFIDSKDGRSWCWKRKTAPQMNTQEDAENPQEGLDTSARGSNDTRPPLVPLKKEDREITEAERTKDQRGLTEVQTMTQTGRSKAVC